MLGRTLFAHAAAYARTHAAARAVVHAVEPAFSHPPLPHQPLPHSPPQVTTMRKEAQEYRTFLLRTIEESVAAAAAAAAEPDGSPRSSPVKVKLENAIRAMQEGLVERETEVREAVGRKKWRLEPNSRRG
eukprot:321943-Chlamydomonas_euryale.AAC.7